VRKEIFVSTPIASSLHPQTSNMAARIVLSLAIVMLATGCGGPLTPEELILDQSSSVLFSDCPSGNCTDPTNSRGIFVAEGLGYCIRLNDSSGYLCPEYFSHSSQGPLLHVRLVSDPSTPHAVVYTSFTPQGWLAGQAVMVKAIKASAGRLTVIVLMDHGKIERHLSGEALLGLVLDFHAFSMRFIPMPAKNNVPMYRLEYSLDQGSWQPYCADEEGNAVFLPDLRVANWTARLTRSPGVVTMACGSGAIATCMTWGYKPWDSAGDQQRADYLFGSCLQAKRAAYFVQSNDFESYTAQGTRFSLQDSASIMMTHSVLPGVEALWSPEGAVCFSPRFRRIAASATLPELPASTSVPECDEELHEAARQGKLSSLSRGNAWLVTAPVSPF
jgi:hypothetical protein